MPETDRQVKRIGELRKRLDYILSIHPQADRENVWHTLLLLDEEPIERLRRSLRRGRTNIQR